MMNTILSLLVLAADIYAILKIVQSPATTGTKVAWVLIVLLLPVLGVVIWYLLGPGGKAG